jgi:hypothetical protein
MPRNCTLKHWEGEVLHNVYFTLIKTGGKKSMILSLFKKKTKLSIRLGMCLEE